MSQRGIAPATTPRDGLWFRVMRPEWRAWRLVFGVSLLSGIAQVAILREFSAAQAISSLGLSIRLVIGVVLVAYGVGAALAPAVRHIGERRFLVLSGVGLTLYLIALLFVTLLWLEPQLSVRVVDPVHLLIMGLAASPPFVAYGCVVAHLAGIIQAQSPERLGAFVAFSLLGTLAGLLISHHYAQLIGVNSLVAMAALASLPVLLDRPWLSLVVAVAVSVLPIEDLLESQRKRQPGFYTPVTSENSTRVFSGWSPYQKVDLYTFKEEILLGAYNGFWEWWVSARTDHPHAFPGYSLLYDPEWVAGKDVLVIGSGAGMGLLHLEESRPRSITAVELDPLVVALSRGRFSEFNDNIYDRVPVYVMEGRSFLDSTPRRFDLILYEGSFITRANPRAAVSAENYLYTREGIRTALERLRPGGLCLAMFAGPDRAFARVRKSIDSQGAFAIAVHLSYPGTLWWNLPVLVFGNEAAVVRRVVDTTLADAGHGNNARTLTLDFDAVDLITDERPFLYAGEAGELKPLVVFVAAGVALLLLSLVAPGRRRLRVYYFLIGAAFMLVHYGLLSRFRSFFGDPVSTSYTVLLLLLCGMALGSARLQNWLFLSPAQRWVLAMIAVVLSAVVLTFLPYHLAMTAWALRLVIAAIAVFPLGILLGVFFPLGLRGQPEQCVPSAYVFDALGTVVGFFLFYLLALPTGVPTTLGVGAVVYLAAWVTLPRKI